MEATTVYNTPEGWNHRHPSQPHLTGLLDYHTIYNESIQNPTGFWAKQARGLLTFDRDFHTTYTGSFVNGDNAWFLGGQLNASFNCIDRHALKNPDRTAIIYEADDPHEHGNQKLNITYSKLLQEVSRLAWYLRVKGVKKGDIVTIYMSMIPEAIYAMLACARIGAVHSVVFAGFSSIALRDRILDANSTVVVTANEGVRGGKIIPLKRIVDEALKSGCDQVSTVLTFKRTDATSPLSPCLQKTRSSCSIRRAQQGSQRVFFSHAGYLLGAATTGKYVFDIHENDRFFCGGDIGWITGHTYVVYAPLLLGCTTVVFEGTPAYPTYSRFWDIISKHAVTHFYVAPTALRLLKRAGNAPDMMSRDTTSLRVLGSVGEPIAPDIWKWFHKYMGKEKAPITDTYWQTETGSHIIASLAGVTPMKPGSASLPMFGIDLAIIDPVSGDKIQGNNAQGVLAIRQPWPSMARTIWGDHQRYVDSYFNPYKGYYFTGDSAYRDHDGYYWIRGRVDDVINVSGHRLSTAEIESNLLSHSSVAEAAVIGIPDELTGQAIHAVISLKLPDNSENIGKELTIHLRKSIGPFATPKKAWVVRDLPKTRSGKIMRRILRKVLSGERDLGDTSTLADPSVVEEIIRVSEQ